MAGHPESEWRVEGRAHRLFRDGACIATVESGPRGLTWTIERWFSSGVQHFGSCVTYADGRARVDDAVANIVRAGLQSRHLLREESRP